MKFITLFCVILLMCSSCATMLNSRFTDVDVITNEPSLVIMDQDTFLTFKNKTQLYLERKNEPALITVQTDSIRKEILLYPKNSGTYYLNFIYNFGLGTIKDNKSPKRWDYDRKVHVDMSNDRPEYFPFFYQRNKGDIYIQAFIPYFNSFYFQPEGQSVQASAGFLGIGAGVEYYYRADRYFALNWQAMIDFPVFFPVPLDRFEAYEELSSSYWGLTHNHRIKRLSIGYGLSYAKNVYFFNPGTDIPNSGPNIRRISFSPGFVFPVQYQLGRLFHMGIVYRPSFYRTNVDPSNRYEHVISIDFAWKFKYRRFE